MSRARLCLAALLFNLLFLPTPRAWPDGPHIALHTVQGNYEVTVFSAPDPLVAGPVSFTLLVQDANSGALLFPGMVTGSLRPAAGHTAPIPLHLSRGASSNPQLPGQTLRVAVPGSYILRLTVQAADHPAAVVQGDLSVTTDQGRRNAVLWAVFLVVAMMILFLANQSARQRRQRHQSRSR